MVGGFFSHGREAHGRWTNPENDLLYIAHEQDELPGTPNAGQTVCTAFEVSDPFNPRSLRKFPLGNLKLPSGECATKRVLTSFMYASAHPGQTP